MASREAKVFEAAFVMRLQELWPGVTRENAVKWMQEYVCAPVGTRGYDWSASTAKARASELQREVERLQSVILRAADILYHNLGRQDEKVRDVEPLLRAALQQEGK